MWILIRQSCIVSAISLDMISQDLVSVKLLSHKLVISGNPSVKEMDFTKILFSHCLFTCDIDFFLVLGDLIIGLV